MDDPTVVQRTRNRIVQIRLNDEEKEAVEMAAELSGLSLSSWIRMQLRDSATERMTACGRPVPFMEARISQ